MSTALAVALPAQAHAAGLTANKRCYGGGDTLLLRGSGFTANSPVATSVSTRGVNLNLGDTQANAGGAFALTSSTPFIRDVARRTDTFTAIDRANPALRAQAPVVLSRIRVRVSPRQGTPRRRVRIRATGFTTGRTLYAHIRRRGRGRNVRVGRLRGDCHSLNVRRRLFRRANPGTYRVQFDVFRRYRRARAQRIVFSVTISRGLRAG
jgi:hypothetical protein